MKGNRGCILLCLILALSALIGCAPVQAEEQIQETTSTLYVYLSEKTQDYSAVGYLLEEGNRQDMEEILDCSLEIIPYDPRDIFDTVLSLPTDGVILTEDPLEIAALAYDGALKELDKRGLWTEERESLFGRVGGRQYAYVYTDKPSKTSTAVLLVLPDLLEAAGIQEEAYTPEGVLEAFEKLPAYVHPLALSGSPTEGGFAPLMGLFDLVPSGGREFYREGESVYYDKFSSRGERYLRYLQQLYEKSYLPEDFLLLSEYSLIDMLSSGRYAMAVLTQESCIAETIRRCQENGLRVAIAELPIAQQRQEWNIYHRLLGAVMSDCTEKELAVSFLQLLHEKTKDLTEEPHTSAADDLERYPLFCQDGLKAVSEDPVEQCTYDARMQYEKALIDLYVVKTYYSRMAVGDMALSEFGDMKENSLMGLLSGRRTVSEVERKLDTLEEQYTRKVLYELDRNTP